MFLCLRVNLRLVPSMRADHRNPTAGRQQRARRLALRPSHKTNRVLWPMKKRDKTWKIAQKNQTGFIYVGEVL
jgi:hypothetical protein